MGETFLPWEKVWATGVRAEIFHKSQAFCSGSHIEGGGEGGSTDEGGMYYEMFHLLKGGA